MTIPTSIIGIDPGAHGAMVFGNPSLGADPLIETLHGKDAYDVLERFRFLAADHQWQLVAYLEKVGGFTGRPQPGSAMFKFGEGSGYLKGCLRALGVRVILVPPQTWQKGLMGLTGKKGPDRKRALRDEAQRRFPAIKCTLDNADALLIWDYAVRQERGAK
jgi:hypothetical protein